jgi:thiamine-monophosphate kinase
MSEFDLIARYFNREVQQGIGDDCAVFTPTSGMQLAISSDMLVEGRHFFADVSPEALGHKALAVNLSDLAACGAAPRAFTLALALPQVDEAWLENFSRGLFTLANEHNCLLIGGDTTKGSLNICITVFGEVPTGQALLRSGAKLGDDIYVSGSVGEARLALEVLRGNASAPEDIFNGARMRLERPTPRVALGIALRGIATSAIDISDGLLGDLGHILKASKVGATVQTAWIRRPFEGALEYALAGGDDYELLFTAPSIKGDAVIAAAQQSAIQVTRIGRIEAALGLRLVDSNGEHLENTFTSFDHFA